VNVDIPWIAAQFPQLSGLQPLAQGGQKVVFAAQHASDGDVVLKLLLRASDEQRLEREVLAGQLVECERVPRVFETGELDTQLGSCIWLREQRVSGTTLRTRLRSGALDFSNVVRLGVQLLSTLAQAEAKRIVHRDIKPENMMVDTSDNFWLLDFGLARHLDLESLTATKMPWGMGPLGYSPPEQLRTGSARSTGGPTSSQSAFSCTSARRARTPSAKGLVMTWRSCAGSSNSRCRGCRSRTTEVARLLISSPRSSRSSRRSAREPLPTR
jgi:serine/threonine protein kinase